MNNKEMNNEISNIDVQGNPYSAWIEQYNSRNNTISRQEAKEIVLDGHELHHCNHQSN